MKLTTLFESERTFVIFSYSMSHGLLLLRSRKTPQIPTRFDILFQDVRVMEIRSWFSGVKIEEAEPHQIQEHDSRPLELMEPGNKAYRFIGSKWEGFILGGIISFHEDHEEFFAPSKLLTAAGSND